MKHLPLATLVLATLTLVGVFADAFLVRGNQVIEAKVQARQQFLNQTIQVNQISTALLQALGNAALSGNDQAVRDLLTEFGITVNAASTSPQK